MSSRGIRFEIEGYAVTIALPAAISQGATMPITGWLPFSQTEFRVIRLLLESRPLSREEIASKLDETADGRLKGVLATLVGRHVLLTTADGYRLNAQPGEIAGLRAFIEAMGTTMGINGESGGTAAT